jgi:hypothetical protein
MKRTLFAGLISLTFMIGIGALPAFAQDGLKNEGVGLYTDASVANQVSTFTINPRRVSCGVGTVNALGILGPFEMIMYSLDRHNYKVDSATKTITADGRMRSITRLAGVVVEDVNHDFIGFAVDNQPGSPQPNATDRFDIHFKTPFWQVGNPACSPSTIILGGCRFGGNVFLGDVAVTP